eukprot:scaffold593_cov382-Prasinococcus_capsulatus_cf.AAC.25
MRTAERLSLVKNTHPEKLLGELTYSRDTSKVSAIDQGRSLREGAGEVTDKSVTDVACLCAGHLGERRIVVDSPPPLLVPPPVAPQGGGRLPSTLTHAVRPDSVPRLGVACGRKSDEARSNPNLEVLAPPRSGAGPGWAKGVSDRDKTLH